MSDLSRRTLFVGSGAAATTCDMPAFAQAAVMPPVRMVGANGIDLAVHGPGGAAGTPATVPARLCAPGADAASGFRPEPGTGRPSPPAPRTDTMEAVVAAMALCA